MNQFLESVGAFFSGGDQIPWCDPDIIMGCEREVADAAKGDSEELKTESLMRLSWSLVHSRQLEHVQRGIAMLEASLANMPLPCNRGRSFIFWPWATTEAVTIQGAGSWWSDVWRSHLIGGRL